MGLAFSTTHQPPIKKALHSRERALNSRHRALYFRKWDLLLQQHVNNLSQKSPVFLPKEPYISASVTCSCANWSTFFIGPSLSAISTTCQKSPNSCQKSPTFPRMRPALTPTDQNSSSAPSSAPYQQLIKRALYFCQKSPTFPQMRPALAPVYQRSSSAPPWARWRTQDFPLRDTTWSYVTWLIYTWGTWLIHITATHCNILQHIGYFSAWYNLVICDMTDLYVGHDSFV